MSTRKNSPRTRGFRPETDGLEHRQLLSGVVSGLDAKGDAWTLRMIGPGQVSVLKVDGADGNPSPLSSQTDIASITIAGTNPLTSRLVGTVTKKAAGSDGRVFFQNLNQLVGRSEQFSSAGYGVLAIDMPNFWLGNTTPATATNGTAPPAARITLPDGADTLRFGGVDTTFNRPAANSSTTSDNDSVILGLPPYGGSRIIIDKAISSTQSFTTPASGTTPASTAVLQHGVQFVVSGRLDLFQANEIDGDPLNPPGQFVTSTTATRTAGGTTVFDGTAGTQPFFPDATYKGSVGGQIGDLRIGGNATNFTTLVNDATGSGSDKIANFSIGGETNNVLLVAPSGSRNIFFGKGMDTVQIASHVINELKANRGAFDFTVQVDRSAGKIDMGGDVVNTKILSGYQQNFGTILTTVVGSSSNPFSSTPPAPLPAPISAQPDGGLTAHVAGDVVNSVFAASVEPGVKQVFGDPNQILVTDGHIRAKVEGTINNSTLTPGSPNQAFYAQHVQLLTGPVVPPNVPEAPYAGTQAPNHFPGLRNLRPVAPTRAIAAASKAAAAANTTAATNTATPATTVGQTTPQGPLKSQ